MRIAIVGPGAIGGLFGLRLALSGTPVTFVAHNATLAAIRAEGLTLVELDGSRHHLANVAVAGSMAEAGPHDAVLLAVKAQQIAPLASELGAMIGPGTILVTMENGLPWWYFSGGHGGALAGIRLESVDPGGTIAAHVDPSRVIGAVEYVAARHTAPTRIEVDGGTKIILGELDGARSARLEALVAVLSKAGFEATSAADIRLDIWRKLMLNASCNPVSALAQATLGDICSLPASRQLAIDLMSEAEAVARATGVALDVSPQTRMAVVETFGTHKTSMLQDIESGHPAEVAALIGAILELARLTGIAVPRTATVYALLQLLEDKLAAAHGRLAIRPKT